MWGVHGAVRNQSLLTPKATALEEYKCGSDGALYLYASLSYAELVRAALALAHPLRYLGVRRDVVVGLCIREGVDMVLAQLGILMAGGCFLPIDCQQPAAVLQRVVQEAKLTLLVLEPSEQAPVKAKLRALVSPPVLISPKELLSSGDAHSSNKDEGQEVCMKEDELCVEGDVRENNWDDVPSEPGFLLCEEQDADTDPETALCHVISTSGSTGTPKLVMCEHKQLLHYLRHRREPDRITTTTRMLVCSAPTFDPSIGDTFSTLITGGVVCLCTRRALTENLGECLKVSRASHAWLTPSLLFLLELSPADLPHLRVLGVGGEAMTATTLAKWTASDSNVTLINVYGVTEAAVYQTHHVFPALTTDCLSPLLSIDVKLFSDPRCAGQPYPDLTICVVPDAESDADAREGEGEVYIGGPQVCRGYLNDEQMTRERFVTLPPHHVRTSVCGLLRVHGAHDVMGDGTQLAASTWPTRFFRTGDRARLHQHTIQLLGRRDGQVKVMGRRVELGEIESAVLTCGFVRSAMVLLVGSRLVLCVVLTTTKAVETIGEACGCFRDVAEHVEVALRLHCSRLLPPHMLPTATLEFAHFPLNSNGKTDRRAIADQCARPFALVRSRDGDVTPLTPLGFAVAAVWREVLGLGPEHACGVQNHFQRLGGDSLAALRVVRLLRRALVCPAGVPQSSAEEDSGPQKHFDAPVRVKSGDAIDFGDVRGALSPIELLMRPRLGDYCKHLYEHGFRACPAGNTELGAGETEIDLGVEDFSEVVGPSDVHSQRSDHSEAWEALIEASGRGYTAVVASLLESQVPPNAGKRSRLFTPLHAAAAGGHALTVELLLKSGAWVHTTSPGGANAAYFSVLGHDAPNSEGGSHQLDVGRHSDAQDVEMDNESDSGCKNGPIALLEPCPCCHYRTIDSEPGPCDVCNWTDVAVCLPHAITLKQARGNFARFGACDEESTRVLWESPARPQRAESLRLLLVAKVPLTARDGNKQTLIHA
jgi:amino acid adenylation domain-containing protein